MILTVVNVGSFAVLYESDHLKKKKKRSCHVWLFFT